MTCVTRGTSLRRIHARSNLLRSARLGALLWLLAATLRRVGASHAARARARGVVPATRAATATMRLAGALRPEHARKR